MQLGAQEIFLLGANVIETYLTVLENEPHTAFTRLILEF